MKEGYQLEIVDHVYIAEWSPLVPYSVICIKIIRTNEGMNPRYVFVCIT